MWGYLTAVILSHVAPSCVVVARHFRETSRTHPPIRGQYVLIYIGGICPSLVSTPTNRCSVRSLVQQPIWGKVLNVSFIVFMSLDVFSYLYKFTLYIGFHKCCKTEGLQCILLVIFYKHWILNLIKLQCNNSVIIFLSLFFCIVCLSFHSC